jgi:hypothetical protein
VVFLSIFALPFLFLLIFIAKALEELKGHGGAGGGGTGGLMRLLNIDCFGNGEHGDGSHNK